MAVATANPNLGYAAITGPWCPSGVTFCKQARAEVKERPRQAPESYSLTDVDSDEDDGANVWRTQPASRFLCLPLEIRMHIYEFVHLTNPAPFLKSKSLYPMPKPGRCLLKPLVNEETRDTSSDASSSSSSSASRLRLLPSNRPSSGLPTALLLVSKQVYNEARQVPLMNNEFIYVNWFSSGVWAAHFFTRHLRPWQSDAIRFVRLEMLATELADDGHGIHRWTDVCEKWSRGLRGLRLRVVGGKGPGILPVKPALTAQMWPSTETTEEEREKDERARREFGREIPCRAWVTDGLAKLRALDQLEVEMVLPQWSAKEKLAWCARLQEVLREIGMRTTVVCVERVEVKSVDEGAQDGGGQSKGHA